MVHSDAAGAVRVLLNPFGTMGAVIVQRPGVATRRQMFDIAITGPLAGLVVTIPVVLWGLGESRIEAFAPDAPGFGLVTRCCFAGWRGGTSARWPPARTTSSTPR